MLKIVEREDGQFYLEQDGIAFDKFSTRDAAIIGVGTLLREYQRAVDQAAEAFAEAQEEFAQMAREVRRFMERS